VSESNKARGQKMQLFDHLVRDLPEMQRHIETERLGGLEI